MKNLLGHIEERLGHVGEVPDLPQTIRLLLMLQYQTQVNQMWDAWCWQPLNTVLVQTDEGGVAKDAIVGIQRWDADIGVVPVIIVKKDVSTKKIIGHLNFNICPFWDLSYLIIWSNLVGRSDPTADKSRTTSDKCLCINHLHEQNASLMVIMIDRPTIRLCDYSHWKLPEKSWEMLRKISEMSGNRVKPKFLNNNIYLSNRFYQALP